MLTQRRLFTEKKPYRKFESISLRHTVLPSENSPQIRAKIQENSRNSCDFVLEPDRR